MNVVGDEKEVVENFFQKLEEYFNIIKDQIKNIQEVEKTEKLNETRKSEKNLILCEKILTKKIPKFIELKKFKKEDELNFKKKLKSFEEIFEILKYQLVIVSEFDEESSDQLLKLTNDLKILKIETEIKFEKQKEIQKKKEEKDEEDENLNEIFIESLKMIQESLDKYEKTILNEN